MGRIQGRPKPLAATSGIRKLLRQTLEHHLRVKGRLKHSLKIRTLSKALAQALADSHQASSWPGDRLPVGLEMSQEVELITQRIQRETEAWGNEVSHA
ncbi:hypothetical protein [Arthrobacter sp.]|uniref:hypothetical protein n=1 Tax=Arthrobacter sp. TaxID=1667 RepID=UPI002810E402|nr:hypothetical protein [Arthrobacter sp.]